LQAEKTLSNWSFEGRQPTLSKDSKELIDLYPGGLRKCCDGKSVQHELLSFGSSRAAYVLKKQPAPTPGLTLFLFHRKGNNGVARFGFDAVTDCKRDQFIIPVIDYEQWDHLVAVFRSEIFKGELFCQVG
jgi:hypothetical protein